MDPQRIELIHRHDLRADWRGRVTFGALGGDSDADCFRQNHARHLTHDVQAPQAYWMKNTRIPLDIIWIDANRRIAHVKHEVPPCHVPDCPSYPPNAKAKYVLEIAGGEGARHGLKEGDVLRFEGTENVIAH